EHHGRHPHPSGFDRARRLGGTQSRGGHRPVHPLPEGERLLHRGARRAGGVRRRREAGGHGPGRPVLHPGRSHRRAGAQPVSRRAGRDRAGGLARRHRRLFPRVARLPSPHRRPVGGPSRRVRGVRGRGGGGAGEPPHRGGAGQVGAQHRAVLGAHRRAERRPGDDHVPRRPGDAVAPGAHLPRRVDAAVGQGQGLRLHHRSQARGPRPSRRPRADRTGPVVGEPL
ncbi:MAG: FIG01050968: hypothetical protein, partial [uncultured Nocardioidaceae bacterium]